MIQTNVHKACVMISLPYTLKCGQHTIDRNEKQIFSHALSVTRSKMRQVSCNFFRNAQLSQNRRQKVFNRGALRFCGRLWVCAGGLDTPKITKSQLIYSLSCFTLGDLELCLGGLSPPWRRDWAPGPAISSRGFCVASAVSTVCA